MTLSQFFALTGVELRASRAQTRKDNGNGLPPPEQRDWGSIADLKAMEAING